MGISQSVGLIEMEDGGMKIRETMTAWTPNTEWGEGYSTKGQVRVGPLIGEGMADWTRGATHKDDLCFSGGAAWTEMRDAPTHVALVRMLVEFQAMVFRDGIDPLAAHQAFLGIDEYRWILAADVPGAEQGPDSFYDELMCEQETLRKTKGLRRK
ncbi:MAG: hypothetical protein ACK5QX_06250 [bacterium]